MMSETVGVRMPPEMKEQLEKIAEQEMRSLSNLVLKILKDYLESHKGDDVV